MKKKGILVISELFLPTKGGTAVWFYEVYRRLGGKEIHILTSKNNTSEKQDKIHTNSVHRIQLKRYNWIKPESLIIYLKLFLVGFYIIKRYSIQQIHAGRVLPEGLVGVILAKIFKTKVIIYAHGEEITTWIQPGKHKTMKYAYKKADAIIANSNFTKEQLIKLGIDSNAIHLISPGVDLQRFKKTEKDSTLLNKYGIPNNSVILLSVGRLTRRKGFDNVIKSLPNILKKTKQTHYIIIGIGEDYSYLKRLSQEYNVSENIHLIGHVSMDELPKWYNICDIFIMPNRDIDNDTEGFGMVFLEAAACGKTSIGGNTGGTGNAIIDRKTGLRIDGNNIEEITSSVIKLLTNNSLKSELEYNAFTRATKLFSWDEVSKKTKDLSEMV